MQINICWHVRLVYREIRLALSLTLLSFLYNKNSKYHGTYTQQRLIKNLYLGVWLKKRPLLKQRRDRKSMKEEGPAVSPGGLCMVLCFI